MIRSITGEISEKGPDHLCLLSPSGIEWSIAVTSRTAASLPPVGEQVRIPVYLHHREDAMLLFGFSDENERNLFLDLLKVSGIGPRQAVRILSGMKAEDFVKYLEEGDAVALSRIPGLGKTTAGKIILALKGKLTIPGEEKSGEHDELIRALVEMGFDRKKSEGAVEKASRETDHRSLSSSEAEKEILKLAIVKLSSQV